MEYVISWKVAQMGIRILSLIPSFTGPMALGILPTLNIYFFFGEMGKILPILLTCLELTEKSKCENTSEIVRYYFQVIALFWNQIM